MAALPVGGESADNGEMSSVRAHPHATYQDLVKVPDHLVAEIVDGELVTSPRPASLHAHASTVLGEELGPPFRRGRGGPGGWILLDGPELHLGPHVLVPDLAGWRSARIPEFPDAAFFTLAPDWLCEVLSSSTMSLDRVRKLTIYAQVEVGHAWLVDPLARTLEVFRRDGTLWTRTGSWEGDARVRAQPFDALELELALLWAR